MPYRLVQLQIESAEDLDSCEFQICNEYQDYSLMLQMYQIDVLDFSKTGLNNKSNT